MEFETNTKHQSGVEARPSKEQVAEPLSLTVHLPNVVTHVQIPERKACGKMALHVVAGVHAQQWRDAGDRCIYHALQVAQSALDLGEVVCEVSEQARHGRRESPLHVCFQSTPHFLNGIERCRVWSHSQELRTLELDLFKHGLQARVARCVVAHYQDVLHREVRGSKHAPHPLLAVLFFEGSSPSFPID